MHFYKKTKTVKKIHYFLIILFLSIVSNNFAQDYTIKGFIFDEETKEAIPYASVVVGDNSKHSALSDNNGFFILNKIPKGDYLATISHISYDEKKVKISLNKNYNKNIYLTAKTNQLEEVVILSEMERRKNETNISSFNISSKTIEKLPSIGAEPDLIQFIQILPSVNFTGETGGQIYIRGGSPIQSQVLLDGITIFKPFHSIGFYSVFDNNYIKNVEIFTGGFGAEYGNRLSSIIDIKTKNKFEKLTGSVSLGSFDSKLFLAGPISKDKLLSCIVSAKSSYIDQSSKSDLYKYIDRDLPFSFYDFFGKISLRTDKNDDISFSFLHSNDEVKYQSVGDLKWQTTGVAANFIVVPNDENFIMAMNLALTDFKNSFNETNTNNKTNNTNDYKINIKFTNFINQHKFIYGFGFNGYKTNVNYTNAYKMTIEQKDFGSDFFAFSKFLYKGKKIILEPNIRFHYYGSLSKARIEPRLKAKYIISNSFRIKLATGMYSQNILNFHTKKDIVQLFDGYLSSNVNTPKKYKGKEVKSNLQKASHFIFGLEYDILKRISIDVETYFMDFNQLITLNDNKIYEDNSDNYLLDDYLKKDFIIERGKSFGVDFLLKYSNPRLFVWLAYSYSFSKREDEIKEYYPIFDRRNNLNLVVNYQLDKKKTFSISFKWNFATGYPFTQLRGFYEELIFENGTHTNIPKENGAIGLYYDDYNESRLPTYHRLDASINKTFKIKTSKIKLNFNITNIYNRENIFYYNRITNERVNQLPFLYSFGINYSF